MTERRPAKRPGPFAVVFASVATFLAILVFLASQMAAGHDPALGAKRAAVAQQPPRRVLVRRVVRQRVIVTRVEPGEKGDDDGQAVVQTFDPTVVSSAPAPAPAPAAAPTTRSS